MADSSQNQPTFLQGLMSAAKPFGNVGDALMGANQATIQNRGAMQNQALQRYQLQMAQQEMPWRMQYLKGLAGLLGGDQSGASAGAPLASAAAPSAAGASPAGASGAGMGTPASAAAAPLQSGPAMSAARQSDPFALMNMAALGGGLGMPGAEQLMERAKAGLQYDPQMATRMEAAKTSVAVDQQMINDALSKGDTTTALGIAQKMRQDLGLLHVAAMSGTQTWVGLGGDISTLSPNEGVQTVNGIESAIPGAAQARGQLAAAEAQGKATAETVDVVDPKTGAKYTIPKSAIVGGGGGGGTASARAPSAPRGTSGAPPSAMAELPPSTETMLKGNATQALESNKEYQTQAEIGQQMVAQVQALKNAAVNFTPGKFADSRATFLQYMDSLGVLTPDERKALGSYQEGSKIAIQLQAAATKQLGSREAAQVFDKMGKSLPNLTLSKDGLANVAAWQEGISRYNIARGEYANDRAQRNDATGVNQTRDTWIKNSDPTYFIMASAPPDIRQNMLKTMGPQKAKQFIIGWNQAARQGFAPGPNDYAQ